VLVSDFDYPLDPELIAQRPAGRRDASRLLVLNRGGSGGGGGGLTHTRFSALPGLLAPGDVLVVNDTKVFPARLAGVKAASGGRVEALLTKDMGGGRYAALMKGAPPVGAPVVFGGRLRARVSSDMGGGMKLLAFEQAEGLEDLVDELGTTPLPPYIRRPGRAEDRRRYQTVYARKRGAVAAPTAGLHFTRGLRERIRGAGVGVVALTLHVGTGTFLPVRVDTVERHVMHEEDYEISGQAAETINRAKAAGGRVVAVGTTSARALESASGADGVVRPGASSTSLFIYPGYRFRVVDALITNFHLPRSTLLMLVCALAGREAILSAYREAARMGYRFYSYGDAMFIP